MKSPEELKPQTLINRVMSGKKQYRTNDYLTAFSHISANDLHSQSDTYSYLDVIKLWNSLQSTPNKVRYFTFSLVRHNSFVTKFLESNQLDCKWAYICHDKDKSAEHKHYHYVLMFDTPRSFKAIANDLQIPVIMLQKVYSKKGILNYLTHENDPLKFHYPLSDVHSNFDIEEEKKKEEIPAIDPWQEFCDYKDMITGVITFKQWFDKYQDILCDVKNFIQRQQLYHRICERSDSLCSGASLSSRSECRVQTPVQNIPIQTVFPDFTRTSSIDWIDKAKKVKFDIPPAPDKSIGKYAKPNSRADLSDVE